MRIYHKQGTNTVTFYPKGTFYQKLNTILKLAHYKLIISFDEYWIIEKKSKKQVRIPHLRALLNDPNKNLQDIDKKLGSGRNEQSRISAHTYDVLIISEWGYQDEKPTKVRLQRKVTKNSKESYYAIRQGKVYNSAFYSFLTLDKPTPRNLIYYACAWLLENYEQFQRDKPDYDTPWPLHSLTFKFL